MSVFKFKKFYITQTETLHKVGTDAMVLGALVNSPNPTSILDIGTGTGVIALMMAQKFPKATVIGLDIDEKAIQQAGDNFNVSTFSNRIKLVHQDFTHYTSRGKYDLIVSNPPYYDTKMVSKNDQKGLAKHEDKMDIEKMIYHALDLLKEKGEIWIIIPKERTDKLLRTASDLFSSLKLKISIFGKPNRHIRDVLVFSKVKDKNTESHQSLIIRDEQGNYTQEYKDLTLDFHYNQL